MDASQKVVSLRGEELTPDRQPIKLIVEALRTLLDEAENGKVRGLLFCAHDGHGMWRSDCIYDGVTNLEMVGSLYRLGGRLCRGADEQRDNA